MSFLCFFKKDIREHKIFLYSLNKKTQRSPKFFHFCKKHTRYPKILLLCLKAKTQDLQDSFNFFQPQIIRDPKHFSTFKKKKDPNGPQNSNSSIHKISGVPKSFLFFLLTNTLGGPRFLCTFLKGETKDLQDYFKLFQTQIISKHCSTFLKKILQWAPKSFQTLP